jgi:hypothetical protein
MTQPDKDLRQRREQHSFRREEKEKEAGQVFPPPLVFPFPGKPASLTEGGQPVVCWPAYETPAARKKFHVWRKKMSKIWKSSV